MMETIRSVMEWAAFALETLAVAVIVGGLVVACVRSGAIRALFGSGHPDVVYRFKHQLVAGLLLGLDLLVASDVIHTAALEPTLRDVATLGLLVIVRIALTWSLIVETEGRWPWKSSAPAPKGDVASR